MAENTFRSYRNRDPSSRSDFDPTARDAGGDPLAELARLIGQGDPNAGSGRDAGQGAGESYDDAGQGSGLEWAADQRHSEHDQGYAEQSAAEDRYAPPPLAASYPPYSSNAAYAPPEGDDVDEPLPPSHYAGHAPALGGMGEDPRDYAAADDLPYADEQEPPPPSRARQTPPFTPQRPGDRYAGNGPQHDDADDEQAYATDDYDDEKPYRRRRSGSVVVIAVLGLAILGTAGAFAYRAMFGGSVLPTLPPIIKASDGPIKIVPSNGDPRSGGANQASASGAGSGEKLVPREEQPVDIQEPAKASTPRVISTIPVTSGQGSPQPGAAAGSAPSPFANAPNGASAPPAASGASAAAPEPKKIHTVTIRPEQLGSADVGSAPAPAPPRSTAARAAPPPRQSAAPPPPAGANAPLALVPQQGGEAPPPPPSARTRMAVARPTPLSTAPPATAPPSTAPATVAGGGYAVQVTSQRSEAEAHSAFRSLRAKYPGQLGGHEPIVRRADLGAKGVYYRALVGPYASMEQAAEVCSSLKAAGGNCIVQRN